MTRVTVLCVSSFTNPHGDRVHQVMRNGMPITRELPSRDAAVRIAWEAFDAEPRYTTMITWDGDLGVQADLDRSEEA